MRNNIKQYNIYVIGFPQNTWKKEWGKLKEIMAIIKWVCKMKPPIGELFWTSDNVYILYDPVFHF